MKLKRLLWALLLSAAMIVTLLPMAVFADDPSAGSTKAPEPKSVTFKGPALRGVRDTDKLYNLETPDVSGFVVTFTDNTKKTYTYRAGTYDDGDGEYTIGAFIDGEAPEQDPIKAEVCLYAEVKQSDKPLSFKEGWNENVELEVIVEYTVPGKKELEQKVLPAYVDVLCAPDFYPTKVEFLPADGFSIETTAGGNYLTEDAFYGEGNAFRVSACGWTQDVGIENFTTTYYYAKGTNAAEEETEGFFVSGNVDRQQFVLDDGAYCELEYGKEAPVEFTYTYYVEAFDEYVSVPFEVPVKATKYTASVNYPTFKYTGKVITPKFKVYDANNKLIPAEAYDVEHEKTSKMGYYEAKITFNDKFADKDKYVETIVTSYGIGPAAPVIYKTVAGKKKLTVKWKKPNKAQLKNLDGYLIELSTDKSFTGNYKGVWVSKKTVKKGKFTVTKGLKRNKKYYVRIQAYKKITQDGEKFRMLSNYSKVKYKKTK